MQLNKAEYRQSTRLDTAGFIASFICAIHCAATPLILASLPLAGIRFVTTLWFDMAMISISLVIASISLLKGYFQYHRKPFALVMVAVGFAAITVGELAHNAYSIALTVSGALTVASSHIVNHFLTRNAIQKAG